MCGHAHHIHLDLCKLTEHPVALGSVSDIDNGLAEVVLLQIHQHETLGYFHKFRGELELPELDIKIGQFGGREPCRETAEVERFCCVGEKFPADWFLREKSHTCSLELSNEA